MTSPVTQRVLILFAHPAFERSRTQARLRDAALEVEGVSLHDLYAAYPDLDIDVTREQSLLLEHDVIVFQHPLYWYSTPAILKEWQDLVLTHGWAYGSEGKALHGKVALSAISAGASEASYAAGGRNQHTIRELMAPIAQTFALCGLTWLGPFVVHETHALEPDDLAAHGREWQRLLGALVEGRVDLEAAQRAPRLNADLSAILREEG